jgi:hypothetical protein
MSRSRAQAVAVVLREDRDANGHSLDVPQDLLV